MREAIAVKSGKFLMLYNLGFLFMYIQYVCAGNVLLQEAGLFFIKKATGSDFKSRYR